MYYLDDNVKEFCDHPIEVQLVHLHLIIEQDEPLKELPYYHGVLQDRDIGPQVHLGVSQGPLPEDCNTRHHLAPCSAWC